MAGEGAPLRLTTPIAAEDRLRADLYALFARLFVAYPDAELLRMIGSAPLIADAAGDTPFGVAWARLSAAARVMDVDAAIDEFEALFGGIGKSDVSLFASNYLDPAAPVPFARFLVELRATLEDLGFGRKKGQNLPEDHVSALFETMRLLIAGDGDQIAPADIGVQREFFSRFVAPWFRDCCAAIACASLANFFRTVAECMSAFLAVEFESFAIA